MDEEECGQVLGQVGDGEDVGAAVQAACAEHGMPAFNNDVDQYVGPAELASRENPYIQLPDGYNGHQALFYREPIEADGNLVKLRYAEPCKGYMTRWARKTDLLKN